MWKEFDAIPAWLPILDLFPSAERTVSDGSALSSSPVCRLRIADFGKISALAAQAVQVCIPTPYTRRLAHAGTVARCSPGHSPFRCRRAASKGRSWRSFAGMYMLMYTR